MKVFKISRVGSGNHLIITSFQDCEWIFEESEKGDRIIIDICEMSEEEINNLPEFQGF